MPESILDTAKRRKRVYRYRSSVTGRYVSKAFAEANPKMTVKEAA